MNKLFFYLVIFTLFVFPAFGQTCGSSYSACVQNSSPSLRFTFNDTTLPFTDTKGSDTFGTMGTGTATLRTPGFDTTTPNNTSVQLSASEGLINSNAAAGNLEWYNPWSIRIHIDNLQLTTTANPLEFFFSKGKAPQQFYGIELFLNASGNGSGRQLEAIMAGSGGNSRLSAFSSVTKLDLLNGYNYDFVLTNDGLGLPGSLTMYANGLPYATSYNTQAYSFGAITVALSGSGTGYADSTPFSNNGTGGSNCHVSGTMTSSGGVPASVSLPTGGANLTDYGCTSLPTITLTAPTGTGAILTPTLVDTNLNLTTNAWTINGTGTTASVNALQVDEFDIYNTVLPQSDITGTFTQSKFYQSLLFAKPLVPQKIIFSEDGCADQDNAFSFALAIAAHKLGYIRIMGVSDTTNDLSGALLYRNMLDQAGLNHVPMAIPSVSTTNQNAACKGVATYIPFNATQPTSLSVFQSATTMYRTIIAGLAPGEKVLLFNGGDFRDLADFMQSPADSISASTGAQMFANNVLALYLQGGFPGPPGVCNSYCDNSFEDWTAGQYVFAHNGTTPIYLYGYTPQPTGPGILTARSTNDPLKLYFTALGSETRNGWDSLPTAGMLSSAFSGTLASATPATIVINSATSATISTPNAYHYFLGQTTMMATTNQTPWIWFNNSLDNLPPQVRSN